MVLPEDTGQVIPEGGHPWSPQDRAGGEEAGSCHWLRSQECMAGTLAATHTAISIEKCMLLITSKGLRKSQKEEVHCFHSVLSAHREMVLQQPDFIFSILTRRSHHIVSYR